MKKLNILWTNADPITSENMVFMYATNSLRFKWWDHVTVIIWGATAKFVAENHKIQTVIKEAMSQGVKISACKACADELGVADELNNLGIELKYWGDGLTRIIQEKEELLTI